jgi:hypothetical protein
MLFFPDVGDSTQQQHTHTHTLQTTKMMKQRDWLGISVAVLLAFVAFSRAHYPSPSGSGGPGSPDYAADSHYAYYQEQYSFFPPFSFENYFVVKNWDYGGSTMIFEDHCRLTPDIPNRRGWMWSQQPVTLERWEAIFALKIGGKGKIYGDGLAFWWTKNRMVGITTSVFSLLF